MSEWDHQSLRHDLTELAYKLTFSSGKWTLMSHPVYATAIEWIDDEDAAQPSFPTAEQLTHVKRTIVVYYYDDEPLDPSEMDSIAYIGQEVVNSTRQWETQQRNDGTRYKGWEWQPCSNLFTDKDLLQKTLNTLLGQRILDELADV